MTKSNRDPDEKKLVEAAIAGDKQAFGKLYEKHLVKIYRFLYVKLRDRFVAEDLTEAVFIKAWKRIESYKEKGRPFHAYLYQIARTTLVDYYRKNNSQPYQQPIEKAYNVSHSPDFTDPIAAKEDQKKIEEALSKLPDNQREVLTLLYVEDYEIREAAKILGKSEGAVRVLKHRGLGRLKKILAKEDGAINK